MASESTKLDMQQADRQRVPEGWRELCRRLYVELFHCDQQMTSGKRPKWKQGETVRDVLADAKAALEAAAPEAPAQAEFVHDPACKMCEGRGYYVAGYSGREDDGNAPIHEECDCWIPNPEAPAQEKSNG